MEFSFDMIFAVYQSHHVSSALGVVRIYHKVLAVNTVTFHWPLFPMKQ